MRRCQIDRRTATRVYAFMHSNRYRNVDSILRLIEYSFEEGLECTIPEHTQFPIQFRSRTNSPTLAFSIGIAAIPGDNLSARKILCYREKERERERFSYMGKLPDPSTFAREIFAYETKRGNFSTLENAPR